MCNSSYRLDPELLCNFITYLNLMIPSNSNKCCLAVDKIKKFISLMKVFDLILQVVLAFQ
jgi:hypothetical protein